MHHHPEPEPESHPPPLPVQHPIDESVTVTEARVGDPLILDGGHGHPSASTTMRAGQFANAPEDRKQASIPARVVPQLMAYVAVMVLLVLIWLLVGVNGGGWYPWPVWPALGWGIGLACKLAAPRGVQCLAP